MMFVVQDMRLVWSNCFMYNKRGEYIEKIGRRGSTFFETAWAMSGLAEEPRLKRSNAGQPAQKYEPEEMVSVDTPTKKSNKPVARNPKARTKPKGGKNGEGEDTGGQTSTADDRNMSDEEKQNLAACLTQLAGGTMLEG